MAIEKRGAMRLSEIPVSKVMEGCNWLITYPEDGGGDRDNPVVHEAQTFSPTDFGLFSSILKLADGSEHLAVIVKSFVDGGLHTDTYVHTKASWLNVFAEGFLRAIGRYPSDVFPYEIFIGRPWKGDKELAAEGASKIQAHMEKFDEAVEKIRSSEESE